MFRTIVRSYPCCSKRPNARCPPTSGRSCWFTVAFVASQSQLRFACTWCGSDVVQFLKYTFQIGVYIVKGRADWDVENTNSPSIPDQVLVEPAGFDRGWHVNIAFMVGKDRETTLNLAAARNKEWGVVPRTGGGRFKLQLVRTRNKILNESQGGHFQWPNNLPYNKWPVHSMTFLCHKTLDARQRDVGSGTIPK